MNNYFKKQLRKFKLIFISFVVLFVLIVVVGFSSYLSWYRVVMPINDKITQQTFVVEQNESLKIIADKLEKEELIRSDLLFVGYVYYKGWATKLQAGEYLLSPSLNITQIARKITGGDVIVDEVQVTIPEGFNLRKIDNRLAEAGLIQPGELLEQPHLEGFLFPDTYRFDKDDTLDDVVLKMRSNFNTQVGEELLAEIEKQEKTLEEIVTMASIIEKEVRTYNDKRIAAGLFWRRIDNNYPLQSCATLAYALGEDKWIYSIKDTKIDSPYNTYQNVGLPPGPICSPGIWSIKAAIYPIKTDYNFFLSEPTNGTTIFSRTAEEHNLNKAKYLR
ncbi:MAG: endolytic transglycosylase MltG [bacterium]